MRYQKNVKTGVLVLTLNLLIFRERIRLGHHRETMSRPCCVEREPEERGGACRRLRDRRRNCE